MTPDLTLEAGLPANKDAERTILGAVLLDNAAHAEAAEKLQSDDFFLDSHRRIFLRMSELMASQRAVDIITLANELGRYKEVEAVGGVSYLASLTEGLPRRPVIGDYIRIVKDKSIARKLIGICSMAIARAAEQGEAAWETIGAARQQIESLSSENAGGGLERAGDFLHIQFPTPESMMERPAITQGIPIGMSEFDSMTCGLQPGELIIVAARPSMGKTAWAINAAEHASVERRNTVAFFSAEMSKRAILDRMICSRGHVDLQTFRTGRLTAEDKRYFADAKEEIEGAAFYIDDKSEPTASYMRAQCQYLKMHVGLDLVVADYIQLFSAADATKRYSREQDVAHLSRSLKKLARDLNVPVVVLAQLSRANEARQEKRPMLSDLRESGAIEQDADVVAFLHRDCYYDKADTTLQGKGEIIIAKQRNGPVGTVKLDFSPDICRWADKIADRDQTDFRGW
ncbi:MAG: replicative DNA helicase [Terracidiphilus sp.]